MAQGKQDLEQFVRQFQQLEAEHRRIVEWVSHTARANALAAEIAGVAVNGEPTGQQLYFCKDAASYLGMAEQTFRDKVRQGHIAKPNQDPSGRPVWLAKHLRAYVRKIERGE